MTKIQTVFRQLFDNMKKHRDEGYRTRVDFIDYRTHVYDEKAHKKYEREFADRQLAKKVESNDN